MCNPGRNAQLIFAVFLHIEITSWVISRCQVPSEWVVISEYLKMMCLSTSRLVIKSQGMFCQLYILWTLVVVHKQFLDNSYRRSHVFREIKLMELSGGGVSLAIRLYLLFFLIMCGSIGAKSCGRDEPALVDLRSKPPPLTQSSVAVRGRFHRCPSLTREIG